MGRVGVIRISDVWWRNGGEREVEGTSTVERSEGDGEAADVGDLLATWSQNDGLAKSELRALSGFVVLPQPRSLLTSMTMLPPRATGMIRIWATTCGLSGVLGPPRHWCHAGE